LQNENPSPTTTIEDRDYLVARDRADRELRLEALTLAVKVCNNDPYVCIQIAADFENYLRNGLQDGV
jgi:hypothetical protein